MLQTTQDPGRSCDTSAVSHFFLDCYWFGVLRVLQQAQFGTLPPQSLHPSSVWWSTQFPVLLCNEYDSRNPAAHGRILPFAICHDAPGNHLAADIQTTVHGAVVTAVTLARVTSDGAEQ